MPWRPLARIAFAIAVHPFPPSEPADLPLQLGDELYIIEEGGKDSAWLRGYLVAPPSLLAGLTSVKGQTLEARVFSGIFPRSCVEIRELLGPTLDTIDDADNAEKDGETQLQPYAFLAEDPAAKTEDAPQRQSRASIAAKLANRQSKSKHRSTMSTSRPSMMNLKPEKFQGGDLPIAALANLKVSTSKPLAPVPMLKIGDETPGSETEPLVDEIASCLREWHSTKLHEALLSRDYRDFDVVSNLVTDLDLSRRQLLQDVLTANELDKLREKVVWNMIEGNKLLTDEIVVRDPKQRGRLLTSEDDAVEVSKLQASMSLLDRPTEVEQDSFLQRYHLGVQLDEFTNSAREPVTMVFYLYTKSAHESPRPLTEAFSIEVPDKENMRKVANRLHTVFSDLTASDLAVTSGTEKEAFLVVKVQSSLLTEQPLPQTTKNQTSAFRSTIVNGVPSTAGSTSTRKSLLWASKTIGRGKNIGGRLGGIDEATAGNTNGVEESSPPETGATATTTGTVTPAQLVKRDIGIAVLPLKNVNYGKGTYETLLTVWSAAETSTIRGDDWNDVVLELLPSKSKKYERCRMFSNLRLSITPLVSAGRDDLIKVLPTALHNVKHTPKIGFTGVPTEPRNDIYITIAEPELPDNALFAHPEKGNMALNTSLDMYNIQLTLEVRKGNGERVEGCIHSSSNSNGQTAWRSVAIRRGQAWKQTLRLTLPPEDVADCHLIMSIANAPGFPFALAWMPLWGDAAFMEDGLHQLTLYAYDRTTSAIENGRGAYLSLPWCIKPTSNRQQVSMQKIGVETMDSNLATVRLHSYLCSTTCSQDQVLLKVLRWKEIPHNSLIVLLRQLAFVPEMEIVKHYSEVFDALFGMMVDRAGQDELEDLVFKSLVEVLAIVHDRRFDLEPLLDVYAEEKFHHPFATHCLIRSYLRLLNSMHDSQVQRQLSTTFKVSRQIIRFILVARAQQRVKEASIGITTTQPQFVRDFRKLFLAFEDYMTDESPMLIGNKTLIVQHFHTWTKELERAFDRETIVGIVSAFVDATASVKGKLVLHKLVLIWNILADALKVDSDSPDTLAVLLRRVEKWIGPYWGVVGSVAPSGEVTVVVNEQYREQVRLCCSIVALDTDCANRSTGYFEKVVQTYALIRSNEFPGSTSASEPFSYLFPNTYPFPRKALSSNSSSANVKVYDESLVELGAILMILGTSDPFAGSTRPWDEQVLLTAMDVMMQLLNGEAFPSTWLTLWIYYHRGVLRMLEHISDHLLQFYLPAPDDAEDFKTELWKAFFLTLLKVVRSEGLALERFPEQKRRAVWKIAGDVREQGAQLLSLCWNAIGWDTDEEEKEKYGLERLGGYQVQYVPGLVSQIVALCMSVHTGLRTVAVAILQSMIVSEWTLNEDLGIILAEIIYSLDGLFKNKEVTEGVQHKAFVMELLDIFETLSKGLDQRLWIALKGLLKTTDALLNLLMAVHDPATTELFRTMNTLHLMEFLKDLKKTDMFVAYVDWLAIQLETVGDFRSAGLARRLHADIYKWNQTLVTPPAPPYANSMPPQTNFDAKERLYFEMIKNFEQAKAWSPALKCYRELEYQYEITTFDAAKLARTQRSMAAINENIARGHFELPRFFRVVFFGLGFPDMLRGQAFVFDAPGSSRMVDFTDKLQATHPTARIIGEDDPQELEGQYIQVTAVSPHRDLKHALYLQHKADYNAKDFYLAMAPIIFSVTTKRYKLRSSVKEQYVDRKMYITEYPFPTLSRRSRILEERLITLTPLRTAIERTCRKTSETAALDRLVKQGNEDAREELVDMLKSATDSSSTNNVALYRTMVAPAPDEPVPVDQVETPAMLQVALLDYVSACKQALATVKPYADADTHRRLTRHLKSLFAPELTSMGDAAAAVAANAIYDQAELDLRDYIDMGSPTPEPVDLIQFPSPPAQDQTEQGTTGYFAPTGDPTPSRLLGAPPLHSQAASAGNRLSGLFRRSSSRASFDSVASRSRGQSVNRDDNKERGTRTGRSGSFSSLLRRGSSSGPRPNGTAADEENGNIAGIKRGGVIGRTMDDLMKGNALFGAEAKRRRQESDAEREL